MRPAWSLIMITIFICSFVSPSWGRMIHIPSAGIGERIVHVCNLPRELHDPIKEELGSVPHVVFVYQHLYLGGERCDLWTWGGKFALASREGMWEIPYDDLARLLGPDISSRLKTPWIYRIPPLLAILLIVAIVLLFIFVRKEKASVKKLRLINSDLSKQALDVYRSHLPPEGFPTPEVKAVALDAASDYLQEHGLSIVHANNNIRLIVSETDREKSMELRNLAIRLEETKDWDQAIELFSRAAMIQETWNQKDANFLRDCVKRVERKRDSRPQIGNLS